LWLPSSPIELMAWSAILVMLVLMIVLAIRSYRKSSALRSNDADGKAAEEDDTARIESLPFSVAAANGNLNLLDEARKQYGAGDYAKAVVYLFSFQLVELDKHQHIHLTKGKTNRQYMREVGRRRSLREMVERTMVAFEDVFFGHLPLDRRRFEACWSKLDEFQTLVSEKNG